MFKVPAYTLLIVLTVDLLATSGDIVMTWTSPMLPKLYSNDSDTNPFSQPITENEDSWIGSLMDIGAMVGPFPYGFIAERFGRKVTLLCIAVPHMISYLIFAFSKNIGLYYFGRILNGLAVGGGYTLLPMYIAEVSDDSNRGMFSTTLNIFWNLGNILPYAIGPYTSILWFNVILACVPATFFVLFLIVGPESPYFLTMKNRIPEAEKVLMKLRSKDKKLVENEISKIKAELEESTKKVSISDFFKSRVYLKGLGITMFLIASEQLSGISAVMFYTQEIFESAGSSSLSPEISALVMGLVSFVSSFESPLLAARAGRRILLMCSFVGISVSHLAFGIYFYLKNSTDIDVAPISWLPIVSLVAFNIIYNVGVAALPWTLASEMFPTSVKHYASSIVSATCWSMAFLVTRFFNSLNNEIGQGGTFWLFGGCSFVAFLFTFFFVPETKGRSFQEIQDILGGK